MSNESVTKSRESKKLSFRVGLVKIGKRGWLKREHVLETFELGDKWWCLLDPKGEFTVKGLKVLVNFGEPMSYENITSENIENNISYV